VKNAARALTVLAVVLYGYTIYYYLANQNVIQPWMGAKIEISVLLLAQAIPPEVYTVMRLMQLTAVITMVALGAYLYDIFQRLDSEEGKIEH